MRAGVLVVLGILVIVAEVWLAPRALENLAYALSYAQGQLQQGYWSMGQSSLHVLVSALANLGPVLVLAALPTVATWWISRAQGAVPLAR